MSEMEPISWQHRAALSSRIPNTLYSEFVFSKLESSYNLLIYMQSQCDHKSNFACSNVSVTNNTSNTLRWTDSAGFPSRRTLLSNDAT